MLAMQSEEQHLSDQAIGLSYETDWLCEFDFMQLVIVMGK